MKAICRDCRETGPTIASVAESKASAQAAGWNYSRGRGFLCPGCYLDDLFRRSERVDKVAIPLAAVAVGLWVLSLVLYIAHLIFEN